MLAIFGTKVRHFFSGYFILFITVFLAVDINPVLSKVSPEKPIFLPYSQIPGQDTDFVLKEHDSNSPKHCEIVELPAIPGPVSHQLKDKYQGRFIQQIIYSRKENSLLSAIDCVISVTKNISPLSCILQI